MPLSSACCNIRFLSVLGISTDCTPALWHNRKFSLWYRAPVQGYCQGDPGDRKTTAVLAIAAAITTGADVDMHKPSEGRTVPRQARHGRRARPFAPGRRSGTKSGTVRHSRSQQRRSRTHPPFAVLQQTKAHHPSFATPRQPPLTNIDFCPQRTIIK
jgi:hypothetical protein